MEVYFQENYWSEGRGKMPGVKAAVEKEFVWDGHTWRIPALYLCEEGIVMDLCVRIPRREVEEFVDRWSPERRGRAEEFTEEELEQLERESPFCRNFTMRAEVDGKKLESEGWCGTAWHPFSGQEGAVTEIEEMLMEAYGCSRDCGWYFCRASFGQSGPSGESGVRPSRQEDTKGRTPHSFTVSFEKGAVNNPGPHFRTRAGEKGSRIELTHPVSGRRHVLTVEGCEQGSISQKWEGEGVPGRFRIRRIPTQYMELRYTVSPKLSEEELWITDLAKSDPPEVEQGIGAAARGLGGVASVGVIGGASAVFAAGKPEGERPECRSVCSALHYEPVEEAEWRVQFRVKETEGIEVRFSF